MLVLGRPKGHSALWKGPNKNLGQSMVKKHGRPGNTYHIHVDASGHAWGGGGRRAVPKYEYVYNKPESEFYCSWTHTDKQTNKQKKMGLGTRVCRWIYISLLNHINICVIALGLKHAESIAILNWLVYVLIGNVLIKRILHSYFRLVSVQIQSLKILALTLQHGNHHKKLHRNCHLLWSPTLQLCTVNAKLRRLLEGMNM